jgi:hypothetical protein
LCGDGQVALSEARGAQGLSALARVSSQERFDSDAEGSGSCVGPKGDATGRLESFACGDAQLRRGVYVIARMFRTHRRLPARHRAQGV